MYYDIIFRGLSGEVEIIDKRTRAMVAPIIIKIINQNEVAIATRVNLEFKYIIHRIIVVSANISIHTTRATGLLR